MDMTAQYRELYLSHWPNIRSLRLSHPKMSPPLLLSPPDAYARQATRLFVIGQETPDWYDDEFEGPNAVDLFSAEAVDVLMRIYKDDRRRQTPFHQAVRDLERALGIEQETSLWSNLNKAGESRKPPSPELADALLKHFPVLRREVAIAKPNVVVFFTGPDYDRLLTATFPGAILEATELPEREFIKVVHADVPATSFRTYHPNYLRQSKTWDTVLQRLKRACAPSRQ